MIGDFQSRLEWVEIKQGFENERLGSVLPMRIRTRMGSLRFCWPERVMKLIPGSPMLGVWS